MKITRKVMLPEGGFTTIEKIIEFDIQPGWKSGNKVTFKKYDLNLNLNNRMGDEAPGHIPADIIFVIEESPHPRYVREGNDLIFTQEISLREALCGLRFEYDHINGKRMNVLIPAVITPETEQPYHGLGMPIPKTNDFGDLVFRFKIRFPRTMSLEHKDIIRQLSFLDD